MPLATPGASRPLVFSRSGVTRPVAASKLPACGTQCPAMIFAANRSPPTASRSETARSRSHATTRQPGSPAATAQHPARYTTATTNVTTVENTTFSDGRLKAAGEYTSHTKTRPHERIQIHLVEHQVHNADNVGRRPDAGSAGSQPSP